MTENGIYPTSQVVPPDGLPEDINLGGYEAGILFRKDDTSRLYECDGSIETGENYNAVYQTVYERNKTVEWRLNCKHNWISTDTGTLADTKAQISKVVQSQEYYDFISAANDADVTSRLTAQADSAQKNINSFVSKVAKSD